MTKDPNTENSQAIAEESRISLANGEIVTIHEYRFFDGMQVDAKAADLVGELYLLFMGREASEIKWQDLAAIFGRHAETTIQLIAMACDRDPEWVRGLSDADGALVQMTWWMVNKEFFIRRLFAEGLVESLVKIDKALNLTKTGIGAERKGRMKLV